MNIQTLILFLIFQKFTVSLSLSLTTLPTTSKIYYDGYCTLYQPCRNGGKCVDYIYSSNIYYCVCQLGYTGKNCDIRQTSSISTTFPTTTITYADSYCMFFNPCKNGGTCMNGPHTSPNNFYYCTCPFGVTGKNCELIAYSTTKTTSTNPTATPTQTTIKTNYYSDGYCELFLPCNNGATCINGNYSDPNNRFSCKCPPGFTGKTCELKTTTKRITPIFN